MSQHMSYTSILNYTATMKAVRHPSCPAIINSAHICTELLSTEKVALEGLTTLCMCILPQSSTYTLTCQEGLDGLALEVGDCNGYWDPPQQLVIAKRVTL